MNNRLAHVLLALAMVWLTGCSTRQQQPQQQKPPAPVPVAVPAANSSAEIVSDLARMRAQDELLRSNFGRVTVGMTEAEVLKLMAVAPEIRRDNLWSFHLSHASDRPEEIDWQLLVAFDNGEVAKKDVAYTCLYRTIRK